MQVIGYTRVSTEEQARSGYGLAAQFDAIAAEAKRRGWQVEWIEDAHSAKSTKRPGLAYARERLKAGQAEGLVVSRLDRLSRSMLDFTTLIKSAEDEGWALVVLDPGLDFTNPAGRLAAHIIAAFAQYERDLISQRTKEGLAVARANGKRLGGSRRTPQDVVNRIVRERESGASLRAIATGLDDDAVPTTLGGKRWYAATVRAVLQSAN
jgi:DNA invertase Pin-like site-specific DNA recombinase